MYQKIDKMVKDLKLRERSASTIKNMVYTLKSFSKFYNQPPELLGEQQIINYLDYCINEKKLCKARVNSINSILKFFYVVTLERQWNDLRIPRIRCHRNLPAYLTKEEVRLIIDNATYLKHKAILSTIYSAGLRVSEATNLRLSDIMSKEMKIRVRAGKGNKERYTLLSQRNLELLREYWKVFGHKNHDSEDYLFTSRYRGERLTNRGIQSAMLAATKRAGIT